MKANFNWKRIIAGAVSLALVVSALLMLLPLGVSITSDGFLSLGIQRVYASPSVPTPIFISGAEAGVVAVGSSGLTPVWNVASGTPTASTTTYRNGLRSYFFDPSAGVEYLEKTISTQRLVGRLAFRFPTLPATDDVIPIFIANTNGNPVFRFDTGANKIEAVIAGGTPRASTITISANTWYLLDFDINTSGATATIDWRIWADGGTPVAQTQATNLQAAANMTYFQVGLTYPNSSDDIYIDDIMLSYTAADYPLGDGKVIGLSPNADGTHSFTANDFVYNASGGSILVTATDVYTYLDEVPITDTTAFINEAVSRAGNTAYIEIAFTDTTETANARGLDVVCSQHSATTSINNAAMNLNDNGTISAVYASTDISQTSLIYHNKLFATAPSTSGQWTQALINGLKLRWGYSTDASPDAYLDGVILEVEYAIRDISNTPALEELGVVNDSSTYYAFGSAPSATVQDGECTFTLTNQGSQCDLDMEITDFTGGTSWNIVPGVPSANEVRVTAYYSGQNPASGLVLSNSPQEFYDALAALATLKWDFKLETGVLADEPNQHTATITITATVED